MPNVRIQFEPLARWPHPVTSPRERPRFRASYTNTLDLLDRELFHLDAGKRGAAALHVVTRNGAADIRRDGLLRAGARLEHPGVSIAFGSKYGPLEVFCDRYESAPGMPGWQANLRAIALTLESLRAVDRYGVGGMGQQYRGWLQIEMAPREKKIEKQRRLAEIAGFELGDFPDRQLLRMARGKVHPDVTGGNREQWDELVELAKDLGLRTEGAKR